MLIFAAGISLALVNNALVNQIVPGRILRLPVSPVVSFVSLRPVSEVDIFFVSVLIVCAVVQTLLEIVPCRNSETLAVAKPLAQDVVVLERAVILAESTQIEPEQLIVPDIAGSGGACRGAASMPSAANKTLSDPNVKPSNSR